MALALTGDDVLARVDVILGLTQDEVAERRSYLGASDFNTILGGDSAKINQLWAEKCGLQEPEDLSDILAVQMGTWTEALNIRWLEKQTGLTVTDRQKRFAHTKHPFIISRVDGMTILPSGELACVEAKHVGPFNYDLDATAARYAPQQTIQMACAGAQKNILSVFSGSAKWEHKIVELDPFYASRVIEAGVAFWKCVQDRVAPHDIPTVEAPMPVALMRKEDFSLNNAWCSCEQDYLQYEAAADAFDAAVKSLKSMIADDVGEVKGKFLTAKRDKRGALRISKLKIR